jgi:hypothetical protein
LAVEGQVSLHLKDLFDQELEGHQVKVVVIDRQDLRNAPTLHTLLALLCNGLNRKLRQLDK